MLSISTDDNNKNIIKRLDQGHLHPLLEHPETNKSRPEIEPQRVIQTAFAVAISLHY